jgi:catechol 2,3-dioxygenase-like lactoylglutathione lyase family enzyme
LRNPNCEQLVNILNRMIGFVVTTDINKAREFYGTVLQFDELASDDYGTTFGTDGSYIRVTRSDSFTPAQGTVLGWNVPDMPAAIAGLSARGVKFEQFNFAFMPQDELGVWTTPNGDEIAWFKDPEGNVLSISKHSY